MDNFNGWLAKSRNDIIVKALFLWKHGYPRRFRYRAAKSVKKFGEYDIYKKWIALIKHMLNRGMFEISNLSYVWIWKELVRAVQSIFVRISNNIQHI